MISWRARMYSIRSYYLEWVDFLLVTGSVVVNITGKQHRHSPTCLCTLHDDFVSKQIDTKNHRLKESVLSSSGDHNVTRMLRWSSIWADDCWHRCLDRCCHSETVHTLPIWYDDNHPHFVGDHAVQCRQVISFEIDHRSASLSEILFFEKHFIVDHITLINLHESATPRTNR